MPTTANPATGSHETDEIVLYGGQLGTQLVRVWLERRGGIALMSHDIGSGLESPFGSSDIETFLEVDAVDLRPLAAALGDATGDPMQLLAARYRGESAATSHLRHQLSEHGIPHRFHVI